MDEGRSDIDLAVRRENLQFYQRDAGKIGSGRNHWAMHQCDTHERFVTLMLMRMAHPEHIGAMKGKPTGRPVLAFVNDNRWMARCECGGIEVVDPLPGEDWFYCLKCFNYVEEGRPRPVFFPKDSAREEIETALMISGDPLWRNWSALAEDGRDPGSSRVNRGVEDEEIVASIARVKAANIAAGLSMAEEVEG
jgi:hypothetical protein